MNEKIYCNIMNRLNKLAEQNGAKVNDLVVTFKLINGDTLKAERGNINLRDGYIEAWAQYANFEKFFFVPVSNIMSIEV